MARDVVVYGFETSNNFKVRVALGYKGIEYEFRTIDPADRSEIVQRSGQYLTPVLVHGDRTVFDSAAILRYLDTSFPDTPRLFGTSMAEQWEIEDRELFSRAVLAGPMMEVIHRRTTGGVVDDAMRSRCAAEYARQVLKLAGWLGEREWLVGDRMTAADVTAAGVVERVRRAGLFELPDGADAIPPWLDRVMAWDRMRNA
jgi:glutathione S-transferase